MNNFELYSMMEKIQDKKNNILVTVTEGAAGKYLFSEGEPVVELGEELTEEEIRLLSEAEQSCKLEIKNRKFFVERLKRPAHLIICGGGHVAQSVIRLAGKVGFFVTVLEDRPSFADEARRAGADQVICEEFEKSLSQIQGSEDTYFLVVTRGHRYDRVCLEAISGKPHVYAGMMASRGRAALLKKQMKEEGTDEEFLDGIHTPVGLSIHAETPEEIAISIIAELIMVKNSVIKTSGYDPELLEYLTGRREPETGKVLATIIARRGSAPRGIGTKMLVLEDGRLIGTVGGGCMESEVQHQCLRMFNEGKQMTKCIRVDMTVQEAEDEGMVCGGTIEVFLEVIK